MNLSPLDNQTRLTFFFVYSCIYQAHDGVRRIILGNEHTNMVDVSPQISIQVTRHYQLQTAHFRRYSAEANPPVLLDGMELRTVSRGYLNHCQTLQHEIPN